MTIGGWLGFGLALLAQTAAIFIWVGGQKKETKGHADEIDLLRKHAVGLDRWIGKVDGLLKSHDEEIDLLRTDKHDQGEQVAINSEQILGLRRDMDAMRATINQLRGRKQS